MAERLAALIKESPGRLVIVLTGNIHNRLTTGMRWNPNLEPMAYLLKRLVPERELVSLIMTHSGGEAWVCMSGDASDCGARSMKGSPANGAGVLLAPDTAGGAYSGRFFVGKITASPPARSGRPTR